MAKKVLEYNAKKDQAIVNKGKEVFTPAPGVGVYKDTEMSPVFSKPHEVAQTAGVRIKEAIGPERAEQINKAIEDYRASHPAKHPTSAEVMAGKVAQLPGVKQADEFAQRQMAIAVAKNNLKNPPKPVEVVDAGEIDTPNMAGFVPEKNSPVRYTPTQAPAIYYDTTLTGKPVGFWDYSKEPEEDLAPRTKRN